MSEINEMTMEELEELEDVEVSLIEKKSLWTKTKEKVSAIGDIQLRDVGKGILKVGAAIGGVALVVGGAVKLLGNKEDEYEFEIFNDVVEDVIDTTAEDIEE